MITPNNFRHILIVGCKNSIMKYIDIPKNKMISITTEHGDNIGDIICIEKTKISERDLEFFHKNLNLVLIGTRKLGIYNGYGNALNCPTPASKY